jgi:DNA modification methylase
MKIEGIQIERVPLAELHPDAANAKRHPQRNIDVIKASLLEHGQYRPLVVQRATGRILVGNGAYEAMRQLLWPECDAVRLDCDDLQATRLALVDNRSSELGEWDEETLANLLQQAGDVATLGWSEQEFDDLLAQVTPALEAGNDAEDPGPQEDAAEALQAKWQTTLGQLWEIPSKSVAGKSHRLLCGDATNADDVRRLMNGERAALFATDPPYLVDYDGNNHPHKWSKPDANKDWSDSYHDWDDAKQGEALYEGFISAAVQHAIREDAAWYCWHASRNQAMLEAVWTRHGAFVHQQIIWVKDRPVLTRSWYMWQHEPCFFGWVKGKKPRRVAEDYPPSVWSVPTTVPGQTTLHPTSKPVQLFEVPMRQHTVAGDVCYEPFSGSGSQHVAGERLGRLVYGLELQPQYVAVILERLAGMGLEPHLAQ